MEVVSSPSRQKSWQNGRERVSVLATLAIQKDTVSRVLTELREQHKRPGSDKPLSQEKAAARAGVTGRQWQRWESGESEPYLRNLEAVASAFNFPVARFLTMDGQDDATTSVLSLEEIRAEFRDHVIRIEEKLDRSRIEIAQQNENLRTQTLVLEQITAALADLPAVANGLSALLQQLEAARLPQRRARGES